MTSMLLPVNIRESFESSARFIQGYYGALVEKYRVEEPGLVPIAFGHLERAKQALRNRIGKYYGRETTDNPERDELLAALGLRQFNRRLQ